MIANGERKFLPLSLLCLLSQDLLYSLKKSRFVEQLLFYLKNEVMAFPKIEIKWDWVRDVHVHIKFEAVIRFCQYCQEPVKHLRIKLRTADMWCKQTHG